MDIDRCQLPRSALLHILRGVIAATKTPDLDAEQITQRLMSIDVARSHDPGETSPQSTILEDDVSVDAFTFQDWRRSIEGEFHEEEHKQVALLSLAISILQTISHQSRAALPSDLAMIWDLIYQAITSTLANPLCSVSRSAQGFLAVPLCSLVQNGRIEELFRLHVWLPDGKRGHPDLAIHSHQPFAQSWILAGQGEDHVYQVELEDNADLATHAQYMLSWTDGKTQSTAYKTHQVSSTIVNTKKFVRASRTSSELHTRDMSYSIPAASFHTSMVQADALHATLFFFDSKRGYVQDAPILGPKDGDSFTQVRDPAGVSAAFLAKTVGSLRSWEDFMAVGKHRADRAEWEDALQAFNSALSFCGSGSELEQYPQFRHEVLGQLANTNRRFGRYDQARDILETALSEMDVNPLRIELTGELGVVYRHMGRFSDAKRMIEDQYEVAKELELPHEMCRAIGTIGMLNYQLSQVEGSTDLLELAITQLHERVATARLLKRKVWEVVGLARLSLCHSARGNGKEAVQAAYDSLELTENATDPTLKAFSRFFYGRALYMSGRRSEALRQYNMSNTCTPAIAMCKEPSEEHQQYLKELVGAGADLELVDEQGYSALDYAVFNGDTITEDIVVNGLRQQYEKKVSAQITEAKLRRGYRELFQEQLRPVLLNKRGDGNALYDLRRVYAEALAADEQKRVMFDILKYIPYPTFESLGRLPRSSEGVACEFRPELADFIIFFSYRWINKTPGTQTPDDSNNTQYKRMLSAVKEFLGLHPHVDVGKLGLWIDHTCVDQDDPAAGVAALPMIIAQCDAVISLFDEDYYDRAWCSVEVMMAQTLKASYGHYLWYEQIVEKDANIKGEIKGILRQGPMDRKIVMADKFLSFEEDRPKVLFLERQSRLLG